MERPGVRPFGCLAAEGTGSLEVEVNAIARGTDASSAEAASTAAGCPWSEPSRWPRGHAGAVAGRDVLTTPPSADGVTPGAGTRGPVVAVGWRTPADPRSGHDDVDIAMLSRVSPAPGDTGLDNGRRRPRRCLIADRSEIFARGLEMILETESEYVVVGRAGEPDEAVRIAARSESDIILAGFEPISDSLAVVQQMHHMPVLVLSWSSRGSDIFDAVGCGAAGFLS